MLSLCLTFQGTRL